jgi:hypothetical protein
MIDKFSVPARPTSSMLKAVPQQPRKPQAAPDPAPATARPPAAPIPAAAPNKFTQTGLTSFGATPRAPIAVAPAPGAPARTPLKAAAGGAYARPARSLGSKAGKTLASSLGARIPDALRPGLTHVEAPPKGLDLQPALDLLSPSERDGLQQVASGAAGLGARVQYEGFLKSIATEKLPPAVQARALQTFLALAESQPAAISLIGPLLHAAGNRLMSEQERCKMLDVFRSSNATGREHLLELAGRTGSESVLVDGKLVPQDTTPLLDRDPAGKTLLDCLHDAAGQASGPLTKQTRAAQGTMATLLTEASRPCMQNLGTAERGKLRDIATGLGGPGMQEAYQRIVRSDSFQKLGPQDQAHALFALSRLDGDAASAASLAGLVEAPAFAGNSNGLLDVFDAASPAGRGELVTLANRPLAEGLLNRDSQGGTLLSSLQRIATGPLDPQFAQTGVTRDSLLDSILQEVTEPGQINQGSRGTCAATSMQYMLCVQNPAEYARLMQGLLSPAGSVKLANGDDLHRVTDSIAPDDNTTRSPSERIFQCAMMDYSDNAGIHEDYDNTDPSDIHRGLSRYEQRRGLEGLFGRDFHLWGPGGYVHRDLIDVLKDGMPTPTLADLYWKDSAGKDSSHAVVVTRVENDRVYFRNPQGEVTDVPEGYNYPDPPRRLEDAKNDVESMSFADFHNFVRNVYQAD